MSIPTFSESVQTDQIQPIFVGLDLSLTSTGVAIIHGDKVTVDRLVSRPKPSPTTGDQASRIAHIASELITRIPLSHQTFVGVEGPSYASTGSGAHILGGLWWCVRAQLEAYGLDTIVIPPASVKKYATGKGNAAKDEVLAAIIRRYPDVEVRGNDEADALAIAMLTARYHGHPADDVARANLDAVKGIGR